MSFAVVPEPPELPELSDPAEPADSPDPAEPADSSDPAEPAEFHATLGVPALSLASPSSCLSPCPASFLVGGEASLYAYIGT